MARRFTFLLFTVIVISYSVKGSSIIDRLTDFRGENTGHTTCGFLTLPLSADVLSRGQASSPGSMDACDIPLYIANTALANRDMFAITHLEWLMGMRKEYTGALFPLPAAGTVGIYSQLFTPGKISHARDIDEEPSHPKIAEFSIGTTFARSFLNKTINAGLSISYVESHLDAQIGRAAAGGFDILISPLEFINARVYGTNFGSDVSYSGLPEPLPLEAGASILLRPLPSRLPVTSVFDFDLSAGIRKTADEPLIYGTSLELKTGPSLFFRAGYEHTIVDALSPFGLSFGAGLDRDRYGADFGYKLQSKDLGSVWAADIKFQLQEITPKTAEDYYKIAKKYYDKHRPVVCTYYAKKALQLDPNMWKAHALINLLNSDALRKKHLEIALIYSGNIKGQFLPPETPGSLGGLARMSTAVSSLRSQFPVSFSLDAGNMLSGISNPLRTEIEKTYLDHIRYDCLSLGEQEFNYGLDKLASTMKNSDESFVCSNYSGSTSLKRIGEAIVEKDKYRVYIASIVNSAGIDPAKREHLKPVIEELNDIMTKPKAVSCDLRVLVIHDTWQNLEKYVPSLKGADIVICGSIDQYFTAPMRLGTALVLSAGSKGQYLGNLVLRFNADKKLVSADNHLIALTKDIPPDTGISKKIDAIAAKIDLEENGNKKFNLTESSLDGTLLFLSNRDNDTGIYLKVIDNHADFPLTSGIGNCASPSISDKSHRIAFVCKKDSSAELYLMDINAAHRTVISDSLKVTETVFTPDGKWVYFAASRPGDSTTDIYKVSSEGGPPISVISWKNSSEKWVSFSPDLTLMAFCSNRDDSWQIYISNLEGDQPIRLTDNSANNCRPMFSPDGQKIAYLTDCLNTAGRYDLWLNDRLLAKSRPVTQHAKVVDFRWLSDSKSMIYSSGINKIELNRVDVDNYRFAKLLRKDSVKVYDEVSPMLMMYHGEEKLMYVRNYPDGQKLIFWTTPDGKNDEQIIKSKNSNWLP